MLGNAVIITSDGEPIPSSTSCSMTVNQEAVEYTPIPGSVSESEAQWKHFRRGNYSWSLQNDSFFSEDSKTVVEAAGMRQTLDFNIGDKMYLEGKGVISAVKLVAQIEDLARLNISIQGNELPELHTS